MQPDTAKATLQFLSRITLQPQEIPAFQKVVEELQGLLEPELMAPPSNGVDHAYNSGSGVQGGNAGDSTQKY